MWVPKWCGIADRSIDRSAQPFDCSIRRSKGQSLWPVRSHDIATFLVSEVTEFGLSECKLVGSTCYGLLVIERVPGNERRPSLATVLESGGKHNSPQRIMLNVV